MKNRNIILGAILSVLAWFGPLPAAQAVVPAPDGGYPGANTAEGKDALLNLTSGIDNTALGFKRSFTTPPATSTPQKDFARFFNNTSGVQNTANGFSALTNNTTGNQNTATGAAALKSNTTGGANTADRVAEASPQWERGRGSGG